MTVTSLLVFGFGIYRAVTLREKCPKDRGVVGGLIDRLVRVVQIVVEFTVIRRVTELVVVDVDTVIASDGRANEILDGARLTFLDPFNGRFGFERRKVSALNLVKDLVHGHEDALWLTGVRIVIVISKVVRREADAPAARTTDAVAIFHIDGKDAVELPRRSLPD